MWKVKHGTSRALRANETSDVGKCAFRLYHTLYAKFVWPIPFGTAGDAQRAAEVFNKACPIPPGTPASAVRAIVFEALGGSYENVRRYVVERCCRW